MTFSDNFIKIMDDLGKRLGIIVDWGNENVIPYLTDLVSRFIHWEVATSLVWLVLGIILLISFIVLLTKSLKHIFGETYCDDVWYIWGVLGFIGLILIAAPIILVQIFDIIEAIYLPELSIYNYISSMIAMHQ
jgi:hypothetical protein